MTTIYRVSASVAGSKNPAVCYIETESREQALIEARRYKSAGFKVRIAERAA